MYDVLESEFDDYLHELDPDMHYYNHQLHENQNFSSYKSIDSFLEDNFDETNNNLNRITIVCQNIRSFDRNLDNFLELFPPDKMPDILIFSETWHDAISPIHIPGYNGYHTIRDGRAGGVSVFVQSKISSYLIEKFSYANTSIEICTVKIRNSTSSMHICGIYRPHSDNIDGFSTALENIMSDRDFPSCSTVLGGDFNVNLFSESEDVEILLDMMRSHHYLQTILSITRPGYNISASSLIDHIWINHLCSYTSGVIETGITDHHTLFIKLPFSFTRIASEKIRITFRDLSDDYHISFQNSLSNFEWENLKSNDVNQYTQNFISSLNEIYQKSFPLRTKFVTENFFKNPWYTKDVEKLSKARKQYHSLLQENLVTNAEYCRFRNKITDLIRKCKENFYSASFTRNVGNIKKTWKLINNICNRKRFTPIDRIIYNTTEIIDPRQIAETFNNFFVNIANDLVKSLPQSTDDPYAYVKPNNRPSFQLEPVTNEECSNIINSLKNTNEHIDHISVKVFKRSQDFFVPTICEIINLSFSTGIFPACFKHAIVIPIFKKGDPCNVSNFRPIAILPFIGKIFERSLTVRLLNYANMCNILSPHQFGFIQGKCTQDAVIMLTDRIYDCLNERDGSFCANVFVDFQKAFDTIDHQILFRKLEIYGITGLPLLLLKNYFSDRTQSVRIGNTFSSSKPITKGVPQGSIIGPLAFLLFINDLPNISNVFSTVLFADDTTISFKCNSVEQFNHISNIEMQKFFQWSSANKLILNLSKTYYIIHSFRNFNTENFDLKINNHNIENVDQGLFLGTYIDKKLNFKSHIDYISSKISKSIGILFKLSKLKACKSVLKHIYYSLVHSHLIYNIICYAGTYDSHVERLFLLQKRALRIINKSSFLAHTDPLFHSNNILKVQDMYKLYVAIYMYNNWEAESYAVSHDYNTRNRNSLVPSAARLTATERSISVVGPNIWNSIPFDIRESPTISIFKNRFKAYLLSNYI